MSPRRLVLPLLFACAGGAPSSSSATGTSAPSPSTPGQSSEPSPSPYRPPEVGGRGSNPFKKRILPAECRVYLGCDRTVTAGEEVEVTAFLMGWPAHSPDWSLQPLLQPTDGGPLEQLVGHVEACSPAGTVRAEHTLRFTPTTSGTFTFSVRNRLDPLVERYPKRVPAYAGHARCQIHERPEDGGALCGIDEATFYPPSDPRFDPAKGADDELNPLYQATLTVLPEVP